ncbi:MAG TPA: molybdopterin-dependent oxidoreductase [Anaerolineaceae bacterium]|nr:molybdopterin-dependent oxidoreductase [Anaerolineaceae bacterium]
MAPAKQKVNLTINGEPKTLLVSPTETLLDALRAAAYFSVKFGCGSGECGACTVIMNGKALRSCTVNAVEAEGSRIVTLEGLSVGGEPDAIQQSFIDTGAIQCGYCSPALMLSAKALLDKNPDPSEGEIRKALNPVLCRCTGYVRGVNAVQRAAAIRRGENVEPFKHIDRVLPTDLAKIDIPTGYFRADGSRDPLPPLVFTPAAMSSTRVIGKSEVKVDARKLALGKPVFTDDIHMPGMLYAAMLTSPHAHARIKKIDASRARALPGVAVVLTHQDVPRVKYASGGQSYPQPLPYDQVCLDDKVRFVGDRVAVVAAETLEIANAALKLIDVEYEVLPAVVDMEAAMQPGAPVIHDEADSEGIFDRERNIVYHIEAEVGDVEKAFSESDHVFEGEYHTQKQQHVHLEPHVAISYFDEDERMVIRTSTQVPFHTRRIIAPLIGLPVKKIRVIKPRIGGGFGNKQEVLIEDLCGHLTMITKRPVRMEYTRQQEFTSSRSRHATTIRYKIGVKGDKVTAASLYLIGDTGAYATHGLTVNMVGGFKGLTLYNSPNSRFICDVVYTNTAVAGAYRGYGSMQCQYGIEVLMSEIAEKLGLDVIDFKKKNWIKVGEEMYLSQQLGEGRTGVRQELATSAMTECVEIGRRVTGFDAKRAAYRTQSGRYRRGIGMAVVMHGSSVANLDMAAATLKMNDDGSFNLLIGATDLGTGSDTVLAQIAAEVLNTDVEDIIVYSSDTDFTPFDKGAYASSTTYLSGEAVRKTAANIRNQLLEHAGRMLGVKDANTLRLDYKKVVAADGRQVSFEEIGLSSLHQQAQHQIMATESHVSPVSPPPTAAQFVEIVVDTETGRVDTERLVMVVDCGRVINPVTASGQVEGGMAQALGFALTEDMLYSPEGQPLNPNLKTYHIPRAAEMPVMDVIFVQTDEPSGPYGVKSVAEISIDGVAPAMASAIHNATGVWLRDLPYTKEKVKKAIG